MSRKMDAELNKFFTRRHEDEETNLRAWLHEGDFGAVPPQSSEK